MNEIKQTELMVTIPQVRYECLLDTETRVDVAVERICNDSYLDKEAVLRILGTELALCRADEIKAENEAWMKQYISDNKDKEEESNE